MKIKIIIWCVLGTYTASYAGQLCKIFHHQSGEGQISIERAKLVLYFSEAPLVNVLSDEHENSSTHKKITFLFPQAQVADKNCWSMINRINSYKNGLYRITVDQVKQPTDGVRLTIVYDPKKISFSAQDPRSVPEYGEFESIGTQKGIMFTLYNQEYLNAIQEKSTPILRTASCNQLPHVVIDCGHGGADSGTRGCSAIPEKDITRAVGDLLEGELKKKAIEFHLRA